MPVQWGRNPAVSQSVFLLRDVIAARPAAAPANQDYYFLATDVSGGTLYQSTGLAWVQVAGSVTDVDTATFAGLTDVNTTGQQDQQPYAWDAGSGDYKPLPGVRGDTINGLIIDGELVAGDSTFAVDTSSTINGTLHLSAQDITLNNSPVQFQAQLSGVLDANHNGMMQSFSRTVDRAGFAVTQPILKVSNIDSSFGVSPPPAGELIFQARGSRATGIVSINDAGGLGLFNATPPTAQPTGGAATAGAAYTATEQTMLQAIYDAARAIGLLS